MSYSGYTQLPGGSTDQRQQQLIADTYEVLQSSSASLQRSNQIAIETEQLGAEVLTALDEQRESLLGTNQRLEDADQELSKARVIIRKLSLEVLYNKIILILIIVLEACILIGLLVLKFVRF